MKRSFLLIFLIPAFAIAQKKDNSFPFEKGSQLFSVQYGFPNTIKKSLESFFGFEQTNKKSIGPVSINYEYHLRPQLSVGVNISYASYSADYKDILGLATAFTGKIRNTALMLQTIKYFETEGDILIYTKGNIGLNLWSGEYIASNGSVFKNFNAPTPVAYNAVVGLKYGFGPSTFGYIEAGYGKYIVAIGLSVKVK